MYYREVTPNREPRGSKLAQLQACHDGVADLVGSAEGEGPAAEEAAVGVAAEGSMAGQEEDKAAGDTPAQKRLVRLALMK